MDRLREGVSAGLLTVDEFEERLDAAYIVSSTEELHELVAGLALPPQRKKRPKKAVVTALAFTVGVTAIALAVSANVHPHKATATPTKKTTTSHTQARSSSQPVSLPPSVPASASDLSVVVMTAGEFSHHDPANQCGAFGTKTIVGGENCYIVVRFTNTTSSAVNFVPADVRMVDQSGNTYSIAPVLPKCYDTTDVNAPAVLTPSADLTVQLCYPVMTGALPQTLQGAQALDGMTVSVPSGSVVGRWGGA